MHSVDDIISRLEAGSAPHKTLIGRKGWLFLINDRNAALRQQHGLRRWSIDDRERATAMLAHRRAAMRVLGAEYHLVSIAEKCAIYRDHLPAPLDVLPIHARPIDALTARLACVYDTSEALHDARASCDPFFRGDSHLNWVGSYRVYLAIHSWLAARHPEIGPPLAMRDLSEEPAGYDGDLYEPLPPDRRAIVDDLVGRSRGSPTLEMTSLLRPRAPRARRVPSPPDLKAFCERPTITTEHEDRSLPRAVIVRDSLTQYMVEFLTEHFSRAVFYWHQGAIFKDIIAREKPDIVLHITAERMIFDYFQIAPTVRLTGRL